MKEISTKSSNLLTATPHDSVDDCMEKMLSKDIRHLPLLDDDGHVSNFCFQFNCIIDLFYLDLISFQSTILLCSGHRNA